MCDTLECFRLDDLEVEILRLDYYNRSGVLPSRVRKMSLQHSRYENVTDFEELIDQIEDQILHEAGASRYVKLGPYYFGKTIDEAVKVVETPQKLLIQGSRHIESKTRKTLRKTISEPS